MIIFVDPELSFGRSLYSFLEETGTEDLTLAISNGVVFQSGKTVMRVATVTSEDGTATGTQS